MGKASKKQDDVDVMFHPKVAALANELAKVKQDLVSYKDLWFKSESEKSQLLTIQLELNRIKDQVKLIDLIANNKNLEAIAFIQETKVLLFNMDIRFGDDASRKSYEAELLNKVKDVVIDSVGKIQIKQGEDSNAKS